MELIRSKTQLNLQMGVLANWSTRVVISAQIAINFHANYIKFNLPTSLKVLKRLVSLWINYYFKGLDFEWIHKIARRLNENQVKLR